MTTQKLRFIIDYICATENEISIDASIYKLSGVSPKELGYAPRPAKILSIFSKNRVAFKIFMVLFKVIWRFGGASMFFLYEMFVFYRYSKRCADNLSSCNGLGEYALVFSSRAADILQSGVLGFEPKCWITFPWVPLTDAKQSGRYIDVFSLLERKDFISAYMLAVTASRRLVSRRQTKSWALQSYTAFRWFAVRIALEKLEIKRFVIAEHYDRWAVLADKVISRRRSHSPSIGGGQAEFILIQHGTLSGLTFECQSPARLPFALKCRLTSVTQLYAYDDASRLTFEDGVFSVSCVARGVDVNYFKPMIELVQLHSEHRVRILFVGHPICENLHISLYERLTLEYNVSFYYKPHPTAGFSESVKQKKWGVIVGRNFFPMVDFLIAYPSTLVSEYATSGIPAVLHSLDLDKNFSTGLLESVKTKLDLLACEKRS